MISDYRDFRDDLRDALKGHSSTDTKPRRRGEWVFEPQGKVKNFGAIICSVCKEPVSFGGKNALHNAKAGYRYCPACGARMEGGEQ